MFKQLNRVLQMQRAQYHVTLWQLIDALEKLPTGAAVLTSDGTGVGNPHSYRGFYEDLALEPVDGPVIAGALCQELKYALGATFTGYKGGEYVMGRDTPLWVAEHGRTGKAVVKAEKIDVSERLILALKDVD